MTNPNQPTSRLEISNNIFANSLNDPYVQKKVTGYLHNYFPLDRYDYGGIELIYKLAPECCVNTLSLVLGTDSNMDNKLRLEFDMDNSQGHADMEYPVWALFQLLCFSNLNFRELTRQTILKELKQASLKRVIDSPLEKYVTQCLQCLIHLKLSQQERELLIYLMLVTFIPELKAYFVDSLRSTQINELDILAKILNFSFPDLMKIFSGKLVYYNMVTANGAEVIAGSGLPVLFSPTHSFIEDELLIKRPLDMLPENSCPLTSIQSKRLKHLLADGSSSKGIHVLVSSTYYSGKLEFACGLAREVDREVYVLNLPDTTTEKMIYLCKAISYCEANNSLLIVLGVEDYLCGANKATAQQNNIEAPEGITHSTVWTSDILRSTSIPVFWITKNGENVNPNILNLFSLHFYLDSLSVSNPAFMWVNLS